MWKADRCKSVNEAVECRSFSINLLINKYFLLAKFEDTLRNCCAEKRKFSFLIDQSYGFNEVFFVF